MNKLNLLPSFINLAGATVLLNSLLSMPAWGANLNLGDSINCGAIALGQVSPGVTAHKDEGMERVADNTPSASLPSVSGDRFGRVTVKDATTGEVIRTFQMDDGVVVRETFLLDGGKTVAASQKDHTVFWDLATGREIHRFPDRIYGFYHDQTKFFTLKSLAQGTLLLYAYPSLTSLCELIPEASGGGIMGFSLAPNDRFLNVMFAPNYPESDENYPQGDPSARTVITVNLFNLETCQEIKEFTQAFGPDVDMGVFSTDSNFIYLERAFFSRPGSSDSEVGSWRFNLKNYGSSVLSMLIL